MKLHYLILQQLSIINFIPPATQTFDSLAFFDRSFDCNSSQLVLIADTDGTMSSSKDRHKLSFTLTWNFEEALKRKS